MFGCRRISPLEVNGHQMFASAGEEERVPVRAEGTMVAEGERERCMAERRDGGFGEGSRAEASRGPEKDRRKNGEGTYVAIKRMLPPRCLTSAFCYFACAKCIWDRAAASLP